MRGIFTSSLLVAPAMGYLSDAHSRILDRAMEGMHSRSSPMLKTMMHDKQSAMTRSQAWASVKVRDHPDLVMFQDKSMIAVTEEQITAARGKMNKELEKAYQKLDAQLALCSNLWRMNKSRRDTANEDKTYIENTKTESTAMKDDAVNEAARFREDNLAPKQAEARQEEEEWHKLDAEQTAEIEALEADMAVNFFILDITGSLVAKHPLEVQNKGIDIVQPGQSGKKPTATLLQQHVEICTSANGKVEYRFADPVVQAKLDLLQAKARKLADKALQAAFDLEEFEEGTPMSFLQIAHPDDTPMTENAPMLPDAIPGAPGNSTITSESEDLPAPDTAVQEEDPYAKRRQCMKPEKARYGALHDRMASMFGITADELAQKKEDHEKALKEHEKTLQNLNEEISMYNTLIQEAKGREQKAQGMSAELDLAFGAVKEHIQHLEEDKHTFMEQCKQKIEAIMNDEVCGCKSVRDEIQNQSTSGRKSDAIQDCEVDEEFVPNPCFHKTSGKEISCSDDGVGGMKVLSRSVLVERNDLGAGCPKMSIQAPCALNHCPIKCERAHGTHTWSTCNKLCDAGSGGGQQMTTVQIRTWPKYGGEKCGPLTETRDCNMHKCDQDCEIGSEDEKTGVPKRWEWGPWSGCSRACFVEKAVAGTDELMPETGLQERRRKVLKAAVGNGECWTKWDPSMRESQPCNEDNKCIGDEVCQAKVDLIFLIDGSGSVGRPNFLKLLTLVKDITMRFEKVAFGQPGPLVAAIKMGNGFVKSDGSSYTITPAKVIHYWTQEYEGFGNTLQDAKYPRGFTNLAQGYLMAKKLFGFGDGIHGARVGANMLRVLYLGDGQHSFKHAAGSAFDKLDNMGVRVGAVIFSDVHRSKLVENWKNAVTRPAEQNIMLVDSWKSLDTELKRKAVVNDLITQFCSKSESPSQRRVKEVKRAFMLYKADFDCPNWIDNIGQFAPQGSGEFQSRFGEWRLFGDKKKMAASCAGAAREVKAEMFTVGLSGYFKGACYTFNEKQGKDSCDVMKFPWSDPNAKDGYASTAGWAGGDFNVYKMMEIGQQLVGSTGGTGGGNFLQRRKKVTSLASP